MIYRLSTVWGREATWQGTVRVSGGYWGGVLKEGEEGCAERMNVRYKHMCANRDVRGARADQGIGQLVTSSIGLA